MDLRPLTSSWSPPANKASQLQDLRLFDLPTPTPSTAMSINSSDFVLDEGLDEDEDVLAFHSQRQRGGDGGYSPSPDPIPVRDPDPVTSPPSSPATDTVIIDGMPLSASRAALNTFLSGSGDKITSLQLRRLHSHGMLRARVKFDSTETADAALQRDGTTFAGSERVVTVKPASPERWDDGCGSAWAAPPNSIVATPQESLLARLPDANAVRSSFWSAFGAARSAAERLEKQAKNLGEELEGRLHVSEKVAETREAIADVDRRLHVSERVGEVAAVGKAAAEDVDQTYGISKQVGKVVSDVGSAARIVVREVDDNLQLSDKAREATNMALKHESIGPTVRSVVDSLGASTQDRVDASPARDTPRKKKNYQPSGIEQNKIDAEAPGIDE